MCEDNRVLRCEQLGGNRGRCERPVFRALCAQLKCSLPPHHLYSFVPHCTALYCRYAAEMYMTLISRVVSAGGSEAYASQLQREMDDCDRAAGSGGGAALPVPKDEDPEVWASIVGAALAGGEVEEAIVPLLGP